MGEQQKASKDHFDNGTTATLIPLFDIEFGDLSLDLKAPHNSHHLIIVDITIDDLMLSLAQVNELEEMLWNIKDILFDSFPELRDQFKDKIQPPQDVFLVLLDKTEQYLLLAMHIVNQVSKVLCKYLKHLACLMTTLERVVLFCAWEIY